MKRYLIAGLIVWVPLVITIWVLTLLVTTLDQTLLLVPESWRPERLVGFAIPGLGVVLAAIVVVATGIVAANFAGQRLIRFSEGILNRIPFVKSIYSSVKQVSDTLLSDSGNAFRKALLVEFPHDGAWTIAFLTGTPAPSVATVLAERETFAATAYSRLLTVPALRQAAQTAGILTGLELTNRTVAWPSLGAGWRGRGRAAQHRQLLCAPGRRAGPDPAGGRPHGR